MHATVPIVPIVPTNGLDECIWILRLQGLWMVRVDCNCSIATSRLDTQLMAMAPSQLDESVAHEGGFPPAAVHTAGMSIATNTVNVHLPRHMLTLLNGYCIILLTSKRPMGRNSRSLHGAPCTIHWIH